jgi:hypothetical protein
MHHPFMIESWTRHGHGWVHEKPTHAATARQAGMMAMARAASGIREKRHTVSVVYSLVYGSWQMGGKALVTNTDGRPMTTIPTKGLAWKQLGIPGWTGTNV